MAFSNMVMLFNEGKPKALTLSYDDNVEQDFRLIDIMVKYGLKGTFNLNSGCFCEEGHVYEPGRIHRPMSISMAKDLYIKNGMEVAAHSFSHPSLPELPSHRATYEIIEDRRRLENIFGTIVRGFAYPYGTFNDETVDILKNCGIAYARTVHSSHNFYIPSDWLRLPATCHHDDPKLMELAEQFVNKSGWMLTPSLFYLWGHSYEFEEKNNWERIEEFAKLVSGRDDIWYATNIEIYDYVQAYKQLRCNVDMTCCYNPTDTKLWFKYEDKVYSINPGEKIRL